MKSLKIALFSLFLTACVSKAPQFSLPTKVEFDGQTFVKATDNQIGEMQQLLYLPETSDKDPNNWQKGILFFLDKNSQQRSLTERMKLRQKAFAEQKNTLAKVEIEGGILRSQIIYPPTERFSNVLLEVSYGQDLKCGYAQIQLSDKRSVSSKNLQNLASYQNIIANLGIKLANLPWQIHCK